MRAVRSAIALVALVSVATACSSLTPSKARASDVYAAVVRWFAEQSDAEPPLRVFVEPRGEGAEISVDVQADVATGTEDVAAVRFIDARTEALVDDEELGVPVVRDDGVLLAFGPVQNDVTELTLDVDEYIDEATFRAHQFDLVRSGDTWRIIAQRSTEETITPDQG